MGVIVPSFDYAGWSVLYPELANAYGLYPDGTPWQMNQTIATALWTDVGLPGGIFRNDGGGRCDDIPTQTSILFKITAHLAAMWIRRQRDQETAFVVGRLSGGGQGSVSAQIQNDYKRGTAQWWQQTEYGSDAYKQTAPFRNARFIPGHTRDMNPFWPNWR